MGWVDWPDNCSAPQASGNFEVRKFVVSFATDGETSGRRRLYLRDFKAASYRPLVPVVPRSISQESPQFGIRSRWLVYTDVRVDNGLREPVAINKFDLVHESVVAVITDADLRTDAGHAGLSVVETLGYDDESDLLACIVSYDEEGGGRRRWLAQVSFEDGAVQLVIPVSTWWSDREL